jgi:hypothetical protein
MATVAMCSMVLVWEAEWEHLVRNYDVDATIEVFSVQEEGGDISIFTIPGKSLFLFCCFVLVRDFQVFRLSLIVKTVKPVK